MRYIEIINGELNITEDKRYQEEEGVSSNFDSLYENNPNMGNILISKWTQAIAKKLSKQ